MKRLLAIAISLTFMVTAFSCGEKKNTETNQSSQENVQLLQYKSADLKIADDFSDIYSLDCNSTEVYIFGELKNGGFCGYTTDFNYTDYSEFRFIPSENEEVLTGAISKLGKKLVLTDEDSRTILYIYSREGELESKNELGEIYDNFNRPTIICGSDYYYINCSGTVYVTTANGELKGTVNTGGKTVFGISADSDGNTVILTYDINSGLSLGILDGTEITDTQKLKNGINSTPYSLCKGNNGYRLYAVYDNALCGLKDDKWEKISDLMDTGFSSSTIYRMIPSGENDLTVLIWGSGSSMYLISETDISEIKPRQVVTLAAFGEGLTGIDTEIKNFNENSEDYRVEVKYYLNTDDYSLSFDDLRRDILTGNAPDIIPFDPSMPVDSFSNCSTLFCDLYKFMEKDGDIAKEDILPNIREGLERNGKMVMITPEFSFNTVPANPKVQGVKENWSLDDFYETYKNKPENINAFSYEEFEPRISFFVQAIKDFYFIDYDKAECSFNSPDYINALKFFNDNNIGLTTSEYEAYSGDMGLISYENEFFEGKTYCNFGSASIQYFGSIFEDNRVNNSILAGFPNNNGESGSYITLGRSYGIFANANNKEGAWSFLKTLVSDEYYSSTEHYYCFPILEKYFDERAETTMGKFPTFETDENYMIISNDVIYEDWEFKRYNGNGEEVFQLTPEPFTQEEYEYYSNLVKTAKVVRFDGQVETIYFEELLKCFNNELSAEETAEHIQERVSLYLSERYG